MGGSDTIDARVGGRKRGDIGGARGRYLYCFRVPSVRRLRTVSAPVVA
jgi:hypothetical protein